MESDNVPDTKCMISRVKALEAELDQLRRSQMFVQLPQQREALLESPQHPEGSPVESTSPSFEARVLTRGGQNSSILRSSDPSPSSHFELDGCRVAQYEVSELFTHFTQCYLPQCSFLGDMPLPAELLQTSRLLLWTILVIAMCHHRTYHTRYPQARDAYIRLHTATFSDAIQNPLDIRAILLHCMYPTHTSNHLRDPSWMHLGAAISAARQIGLDQPRDEIFFGLRRAPNQLRRFSQKNLKLTWLKCFELDVQISLWHGQLPTLAASRHFRTVEAFCRDPGVSTKFSISMGIHVRTARYLALLDETASTHFSWNLATNFAQDLTALRADNLLAWSREHDACSAAAQIYICMACFNKHQSSQAEANGKPDISTAQANELLQTATDHAITFIDHASALSAANKAPFASQDYLARSSPFPGSPKNTSQTLFCAAAVLLRFLDSNSPAQESARIAFQNAYALFCSADQSPDHTTAARLLELAGRAIGRRQARLHSRVTTRMGAGVVYDVTWLGGLLRGREREREYAVDADAGLAKERGVCAPLPRNTASEWTCTGEIADAATADDGAFSFGLWDDGLYDDLMGCNAWDQWFPGPTDDFL